MKKIVSLIIAFTFFAVSNAQPITVSDGVIEIYQNFASVHVQPRNVAVWLPPNYNPKKKHPVLYMHDGQMLFDANTTFNKTEWGVDECLTKLFREGKIQNTIVVGIWNTEQTRHQEYFPQKPYESLSIEDKEKVANALEKIKLPKEFKPFSDNYLKFIVEELKPFIDKTYSTYTTKDRTFIAGSSMGGLISLYALCEYPSVFGGAACLSTHWPGTFEVDDNPIPEAFYAYLKKNLPNPKSNKIYFDYGTEKLDALYPPLQAKIDDIMNEKGFSSQNWITQKFEGEDHSETAWKKRLHIPMEFLLKK